MVDIPRHSFRMSVDYALKTDVHVVTILEKNEDGSIGINGTFTPQQLKERIEFLEKTASYSETPPAAITELRILRCARDLLAEEEHNTAFYDLSKHLRSDTSRKNKS